MPIVIVDVVAIDVGVPDALGVDDDHRSFLAAIRQPVVHAHLALPFSPSFLIRSFAYACSSTDRDLRSGLGRLALVARKRRDAGSSSSGPDRRGR
jgi:hypothetical protein